MKSMPGLVLLFLCGAATAYDPQNPCNLPSPPPPVAYTDFLDRGVIDCVPWPFQGLTDSNSSTWDFYRTPTGYVAAWYCKGSDGKWGYQLASITNAEVDSHPGYFTSLASDLLTTQAANPASAPAVVLAAVAKTRVNTTQNNETQAAAWCPAWASIWAKWPDPKNLPAPPPPPPPPPVTWAVAKNGTTATRPAYGLVGTVLGFKVLGNPTVGTSCDCTTPFVKNTLTYCPYAGAPATAVTVCTKVP